MEGEKKEIKDMVTMLTFDKIVFVLRLTNFSTPTCRANVLLSDVLLYRRRHCYLRSLFCLRWFSKLMAIENSKRRNLTTLSLHRD